DFGIDGWRLDVAREIDDDAFWREFRRRVKAGNPEAYIVGEVWLNAAHWLKGDMWDASMNYIFARSCIAFFIGEEIDYGALHKTLTPPGPPGAEAFAKAVAAMEAMYHPHVVAAQLNLLSSHDTARFVTVARGDQSALRLATLFQMTYTGPPSLYYGDEVGLAGGHDPLNRGAMPWDEATWDHDLLRGFRRMIALRKARPSLRRGSYSGVYARDGVHVHLRRLDNDVVVVALNTDRVTRRIDIPVISALDDGATLEEAWANRSLRVEGGMLRGVELAPRSGRVFQTPL
ncbi:MAG TPA: alpha-amylase family glycosyl hydrolase, partial [Isosphaeraceae bacterium]|nr:alpha-amylase family glycosyl hydrolase [Isosphaeraceae bacterium]